MSNVTINKKGGVGFLGLLTLILVVLKVLGYISLSWFWVFFPIFIPFAIIFTVAVIAFLIYWKLK